LKLEIESKKENPLLERTEVSFSVEHAGKPTPNRDEVRAAIASALSVQKEMVIIDHMDTEYGKGLSIGYVKIYKTQEAAMKGEKRHLLVRNKMAEKKVKAKAAPKARAAPKAK